MKPTQAQIRAMITPDMVQAANALVMAQAYTQTIRPIVEGYQKEILARHQFINKGEKELFEKLGRKFEETVVLDPNQSFLLSEEDAKTYFEEVEEARIKSGLEVQREGNCPLLEAEELERKAERVFIDAMAPITKMTHEQVWSSSGAIENAKKLVKLSLGLIASLGLLKNTLKKATV